MVGSKRIAACRSVLSLRINRTHHLISAALVTLGICAVAAIAAEQTTAPEPEEEYGEFLARAQELASLPVNDIFKSIRLTAGAMLLGKKVYEKNCATCHGADLKGIPDQHTPDLTDGEWRFSGDDLASGATSNSRPMSNGRCVTASARTIRMRADWKPICWLTIQNIVPKTIRRNSEVMRFSPRKKSTTWWNMSSKSAVSKPTLPVRPVATSCSMTAQRAIALTATAATEPVMIRSARQT